MALIRVVLTCAVCGACAGVEASEPPRVDVLTDAAIMIVPDDLPDASVPMQPDADTNAPDAASSGAGGSDAMASTSTGGWISTGGSGATAAGGVPSSGGTGGQVADSGGGPVGPRCDFIQACAGVLKPCTAALAVYCGAIREGTFQCGDVSGWYFDDGTSYACQPSSAGMDCTDALSMTSAHCSDAFLAAKDAG